MVGPWEEVKVPEFLSKLVFQIPMTVSRSFKFWNVKERWLSTYELEMICLYYHHRTVALWTWAQNYRKNSRFSLLPFLSRFLFLPLNRVLVRANYHAMFVLPQRSIYVPDRNVRYPRFCHGGFLGTGDVLGTFPYAQRNWFAVICTLLWRRSQTRPEPLSSTSRKRLGQSGQQGLDLCAPRAYLSGPHAVCVVRFPHDSIISSWDNNPSALGFGNFLCRTIRQRKRCQLRTEEAPHAVC